MASTSLVTFPLYEGKRLADALATSLDLEAAFWLYYIDGDEWRLVLATPLVESFGPREVYERIDSMIASMPEIKSIHLWNISALSPSDPMVRPIISGLANKVTADGMLVRKSVVTGDISSVYLEEAYIYFVRK